MRTTYRVFFIDANDGYANQKLIEADNEQKVYDYVTNYGHDVIDIEVA